MLSLTLSQADSGDCNNSGIEYRSDTNTKSMIFPLHPSFCGNRWVVTGSCSSVPYKEVVVLFHIPQEVVK